MKPLTFDDIIKLLEKGEKSIHCKLMLDGCYSAKDIYYESDKKIEVFNYIDESREILGPRSFKKWYGENLFFDSFN